MSALADEIEAAVRRAFDAAIPRVIDEVVRRIGNVTAQDAGLLDVHEAAQRLGLSTSTIYKWAKACKLPSVPMGRRVLFRASDLDAPAWFPHLLGSS